MARGDGSLRDIDEREGPEGPRALVPPSLYAMPVEAVIHLALTGGLARYRIRGLKYYEAKNLNEANIQVVMMRAAGLKQREIARQLGLDEARVSVTLAHPDAHVLLSVLMGRQANEAADIRSQMRLVAGEMLGHVVATARSTQNDQVRLKAAFGLLDRAGYGQVEEKRVTHSVQVSDEAMDRVANALERFAPEALEDVSDYSSFTMKGSEAEAPSPVPIGPGTGGASNPPTSGSPMAPESVEAHAETSDEARSTQSGEHHRAESSGAADSEAAA